MRINVRFLSMRPSDSLRDYAARRIHFSLGRFSPQLATATVRLTDVNGPKGGRDCRCQIQVVGPRIGVHTLEQLHEDPHAALDLGLERIGRSIGRCLERLRGFKARAARTAGGRKEGKTARRPADTLSSIEEEL